MFDMLLILLCLLLYTESYVSALRYQSNAPFGHAGNGHALRGGGIQRVDSRAYPSSNERPVIQPSTKIASNRQQNQQIMPSQNYITSDYIHTNPEIFYHGDGQIKPPQYSRTGYSSSLRPQVEPSFSVRSPTYSRDYFVRSEASPDLYQRTSAHGDPTETEVVQWQGTEWGHRQNDLRRDQEDKRYSRHRGAQGQTYYTHRAPPEESNGRIRDLPRVQDIVQRPHSYHRGRYNEADRTYRRQSLPGVNGQWSTSRSEPFRAQYPPHPLPMPHLGYVNAFDDSNPNNWVTPYRRIETPPRSVIIHLYYDNFNFLGTVTVGVPGPGHPEQPFRASFDTAGVNTAVVSREACHRGFCHHGQLSFDGKLSQTFKKIGVPVDINYVAEASVHGFSATDYVIMGGVGNRLVIKDQEFVEVVEFSKIFTNFDILFGLSLVLPSDITEGRPNSLLCQMKKQFGITPTFSFYLNRYTTARSKLIFGIEESKEKEIVIGSLRSHIVITYPNGIMEPIYFGWNLRMDGWIIEDRYSRRRPIRMPVPSKFYANVDTGSVMIAGPEKLIGELNAAIFSFAQFQVYTDHSFSCQEDIAQVWSELPDVSIVLDGQKYTLESQDYIGQFAGQCSTFFKPLKIHDYILLGRPFLLKFYSKYDYDNRRVHLGLARQDPHPHPYLRRVLQMLGRQ